MTHSSPSRLSADLSAYVSRERVVANNAMTDARVQEAQDSAAVGWNDPDNIKRQLGIAAGEVSEFAERNGLPRSEEHTSELQSLMRRSYAVFCLKRKTFTNTNVNEPPCLNVK